VDNGTESCEIKFDFRQLKPNMILGLSVCTSTTLKLDKHCPWVTKQRPDKTKTFAFIDVLPEAKAWHGLHFN
jgi:hypothetical protein